MLGFLALRSQHILITLIDLSLRNHVENQEIFSAVVY
jgi:hypothetical protein